MKVLKEYEKWRKNSASRSQIIKNLVCVPLELNNGTVNRLQADLQTIMDRYDENEMEITYQPIFTDNKPMLAIYGKRWQTDFEFEKYCDKMKQRFVDNEKRDRAQYEELRKRFEKISNKERKEYDSLRKKIEEQEKHERKELARLKSKYGG